MASGLRPTDSQMYRIRIDGTLSEGWSDWFGGMRIEVEGAEGPARTTLLTGSLDHSGLHGILARIRDLNLKLISVGYAGGLAGTEDPEVGLTASAGAKQDGDRNPQ